MSNKRGKRKKRSKGARSKHSTLPRKRRKSVNKRLKRRYSKKRYGGVEASAPVSVYGNTFEYTAHGKDVVHEGVTPQSKRGATGKRAIGKEAAGKAAAGVHPTPSTETVPPPNTIPGK